MRSNKTRQTSTNSFWGKHIKHFIIGFVVIALVIVIGLGGSITWHRLRTQRQQAKLQPFYTTDTLPLQGPPGEVVRQEPLDIYVEGGSAVRVLYRTQRADGSPAFSSGMIFIPSESASGSRPVVAWAHGTVGMGDQCAPSRIPDPIGNIGWVSQMLKNGWVVAATDYAGLGTPGTQAYLIGQSEAYDVLNSVRAARSLPQAQAGSTFVVWGHSQGGHSALFTAQQASGYAPELQLAGTAAAAPAAELIPLLTQQYGTVADWVIGPEIVTAWPDNNPELPIQDVLTPTGQKNYQKIANKCIEVAAVDGLVRTKFKQQFFSTNPITIPAWRAEAQRQTAPILTPQQPVLVAESLTDNVVLPNTTALYIQSACSAGSTLTSLWVTDVTHMALAQVVAPDVIGWIGDRFAGKPADSTCGQPLPVAPASSS